MLKGYTRYCDSGSMSKIEGEEFWGTTQNGKLWKVFGDWGSIDYTCYWVFEGLSVYWARDLYQVDMGQKSFF